MKTKYEKDLFLKASLLPDAGKGLFTKVPIKKGEKIVAYKGEIVPWKICERRFQQDEGGYAFYVTSKYCIDAYPTPQYLGRYANDARGLSRVKGLRNNSVYEVFDKRSVFIVATKDIPAGSDIFVDYGTEYWGAVRDRIKEKRKARKTAERNMRKTTRAKKKSKTKSATKKKAKKAAKKK
jgi:uncharacterized protein